MAEPRQIFGSVGPADPEHLGPQVLELSGMLQTALDVEQQMELLAKAIRNHIEIDGLEYSNRAIGMTYRSGNTATHRATYDLKLDEMQLGSLCFCRELPFTQAELKLVENLLCGLVYPLRNALTYLEALQLTSHDPLTGVQNRLAMQQALEREVDLARRQQAPLSILVIDADHFKRFNDEFGHAFGDDVLRALANAAAATIRRSDLLFRYGGEEFVVLASHTGARGGATAGRTHSGGGCQHPHHPRTRSRTQCQYRPGGICQDRCRLFDHAARHFSSLLRSGFNATDPTGSQFRVWPDHRAGLAAFACS